MFPSECGQSKQNPEVASVVKTSADVAAETVTSTDGKSVDTISHIAVWEQAKDMCVELTFHFHRIALKLHLPASFSELHFNFHCVCNSTKC